MRGPKPKSPRLRILNGNASKRPVASDIEPASIPAKPKEFSPDASREWDRITAELAERGRVTQLNLADLAAYCIAYARMLKAERNLKRQGEILKGARNGGSYQNPWLAVAKRAAEQVAKFGSRLRLESSEGGHKQTDAFDDFLNESATG